jgi:serine phosphatase RsbU (regulator of sigma subunit)
MLVQGIVVNNLLLVNQSLDRITNGNLNEVVDVRKSSEFASLSDDINHTVSVLKGYIEAAEKRIEQELEFAFKIQDSSLPKNFTFSRDDFELYATMDPAKEVGGDFYDFFFVGQNRLALVIADVSGKGIPAALFMMRAKTAIRGLAESGQTPSQILYRANNTLCDGNEAEMFVTVWLGIIDLATGKMTCANAGHEYPTLMRAGGEFEALKDRHGPALAAMEDMPFREYELQLNPGDKLFVYTDGIPEAIDENVEQYGMDRLLEALNTAKDETMQDILPAVRRHIQNFVGEADQFDDITMLGLHYKGGNGAQAHE